MFSIETSHITTWGELYCSEQGGNVSYIPPLKTKDFCLVNGIYYHRRHALTDGQTKHDFLRSDDFVQCLGVLGISEKMHHQLAHLCPGTGINKGAYTTHLLKCYKAGIVKILEKWRECALIEKNGLHIFGGTISPNKKNGEDSYRESITLLGEMLHTVFGFDPKIAHGPSLPGERQFVRVEEKKAQILIGDFNEPGFQLRIPPNGGREAS